MTAAPAATVASRATAMKAFSLCAAVGEALQALCIVLVVFSHTRNAFIVGVVGAMSYLPGVVVSLVRGRHADAPGTERRFGRTNLALVLSAGAVACALFAGLSPYSLVAVCLVAQGATSVVKALNKGYAARIIRLGFPPEISPQVVQAATSWAVIGSVGGAGLGGVVASLSNPAWGCVVACGFYAAAFAAARYAIPQPELESPPVPAAPEHTASARSASTGPEGLWRAADTRARRAMLIALAFAVPSSAVLPYINTLFAPIAAHVAPSEQAAALSILNVASSIGGVAAGVVLARTLVPLSSVLRWGLGLSAVVVVLAGASHHVFLAACATAVLCAVATAHVMGMQVLCNQAPPAASVAHFTLVRNAVAGVAKAVAALGAGALAQSFSVMVSYVVLGVVLSVSQVLWLALVRAEDAPTVAAT